MNMNIINLTAHSINEMTTGTIIPASGMIARVEQQSVKAKVWHSMPIFKTEYGELMGLPAPKKGTLYIVSAMALNAVPKNRTDVVAPGYLKRGEDGQPIGCIGFRINNN